MHEGGTYVCIEGPQFSTRAEIATSTGSWGFDVIGMTNLQEAKLAREAELCYATMALVTDYDVWYEGEEDVTLETGARPTCGATSRRRRPSCGASCRHSTCRRLLVSVTRSSPPSTRRRSSSRRQPEQKLDLLIGKYLR